MVAIIIHVQLRLDECYVLARGGNGGCHGSNDQGGKHNYWLHDGEYKVPTLAARIYSLLLCLVA